MVRAPNVNDLVEKVMDPLKSTVAPLTFLYSSHVIWTSHQEKSSRWEWLRDRENAVDPEQDARGCNPVRQHETGEIVGDCAGVSPNVGLGLVAQGDKVICCRKLSTG